MASGPGSSACQAAIAQPVSTQRVDSLGVPSMYRSL